MITNKTSKHVRHLPAQESEDLVTVAQSQQLPKGSRGARILEQLKPLRAALEAVEARYVALLTEDPTAVPGWTLKEGAQVRQICGGITEVRGAMAGELSDEQFLSCCKTSLTALSAAVADAAHTTKAQAEVKVDALLGDHVQVRQNRSTLARVS